jgi:glycosyltransferase involved in cell wall biosynthesis
MTNVILGPPDVLHNGIHGALEDAPPPGVTYVRQDGVHEFAFAAPDHEPFKNMALAQGVNFGEGEEIVHTAYYPVFGRSAWLVETGDLILPLFCGQFVYNADFRDQWASASTRTPEQDAYMRQRVRRMAAAYAHDSCRAVLLYTENEVGCVSRLLPHVIEEPTLSALLAKLRVCRPTVQPVDDAVVRNKWQARDTIEVLFCGRWFKHKKGHLALHVFQSLRRELGHRVHLTYVGHLSEQEMTVHRDLLDGVEHLDQLPRDAVLERMRQAHILLHPSESEGLGMVLLEAAAAGMAIVCGRDEGMRHTDEWFDGDGAVRLDRRGLSEQDELAWFAAAIVDLVRAPEVAMRHGIANHARACHGVLSKAARDRVLLEVYEQALSERRDRLALSTLGSGGFVRTYGGQEMRGIKSAHTRANGTSHTALCVHIDV